jgi:voltage-gated potassium channel
MSLFIGITGYMTIEDYTFLEALFMSVITISTVGFTEVHLLSDNGMIFTIIYIILNLILLAYIISVISKFIFEGKLKSIYQTFMFEKHLSKLSNHIIVCGYGSNGSHTCEELYRNKKKFVIIDSNNDIPKKFPADVEHDFICGDATNEEVLIRAGVKNASVLIIATSSDAANVFITLTARELNPRIKIISRASEPSSEKKLYHAGATNVILPDVIGGTFMARLITKPEVIEFMELLSGDNDLSIRLEEYKFDQLKTQYKNKTINELEISNRTGVTLVGFKDNIKGFMPFKPETVFGENDIMIILGTDETLKNFKDVFVK